MERVPLTDTEVRNRANALTHSQALKLANGGFVFDASTQQLIDDALAKYNTTSPPPPSPPVAPPPPSTTPPPPAVSSS